MIQQANTSLPSPPGDNMTAIGYHGDIECHGYIGYHEDVGYHRDMLISHNSSHDTHYHGDDETDGGYKQSKLNSSDDDCTLSSVQTQQHSHHETQLEEQCSQQHQHCQQQQQHHSQQQQQKHKQSSKQLGGRRPSLEGIDHVGRTKRQQSNEDKNKSSVVQQVTKTRHVSRRRQHYGTYRSQSGSNLHHYDNTTAAAQRLPVVKSCSGEL